MKYADEYQQIAKFWIGPKLLVFLIDPRDIEIILSSHIYIDKSTEYRFFQPWLGNGLLISSGTYISFLFFYFYFILITNRQTIFKFSIIFFHLEVSSIKSC